MNKFPEDMSENEDAHRDDMVKYLEKMYSNKD